MCDEKKKCHSLLLPREAIDINERMLKTIEKIKKKTKVIWQSSDSFETLNIPGRGKKSRAPRTD